MQPFAIVAPRREASHPAMWVGIHRGEPRLVSEPSAALQFAREQDAHSFVPMLDPSFEWSVTQDFANPPVPGEGGFTSA